MLTDAQNYAVVQTELDDVFYPNFEYDSSNPGIATARTGEIFKVMNIANGAYIQEVFGGNSYFAAIGETQTVPLSTPKVANKQTTYPLDFAGSVELSKDWFDDQMHGVWSQVIENFALRARVTQDKNCFSAFINGFTTFLTPDGSAWFSTHTLINGGTQSNTATGALTPANLNLGIVSLREQKDQGGMILGQSPAYLVVPSALFKHACEIVQSVLLADSGNNNVNVYSSIYDLRIFSSPQLGAAAGGSDTAWFLLGRNHGLRRLIRQGIQTNLRDWSYSNNRTYLYQANFRENVFVSDYVASYGSTGTTA